MSESSQNNTKNGKLLPCPFCGGKAMRAKSNSGTWSVICQNCDTGIFRPRYKTNEWNAFDTEAEAVDAWNTRAERTCRSTTDDNAWCFVCSECGKSFPRNQLHLAHNHGEINYCPNCGSRVTKSDQYL